MQIEERSAEPALRASLLPSFLPSFLPSSLPDPSLINANYSLSTAYHCHHIRPHLHPRHGPSSLFCAFLARARLQNFGIQSSFDGWMVDGWGSVASFTSAVAVPCLTVPLPPLPPSMHSLAGIAPDLGRPAGGPSPTLDRMEDPSFLTNTAHTPQSSLIARRPSSYVPTFIKHMLFGLSNMTTTSAGHLRSIPSC